MKKNIFLSFLAASVFTYNLAAQAQLSFTNDPAVNSFDLATLKGKGPQVGTSYTIDTRDQQTCKDIQKNLKLGDELCHQDKDRPYATVAIFHQQDGEIEYGQKIMDVSNKQLTNTRNIILIDIAAFAYLLAQPQSETHWEGLSWDTARSRYFDHIESVPVFDKDDFATNYIKHPIAGSIYYSLARHSGAGVLRSFGFSVVCSTFLWEYGMEAIAEKPSINDMIATPVIGSLLGELSYQLSRLIDKNDGKVLGSPFIGTVVKLITDPGYYVSEALNQILGVARFKSAGLYWVVQDNTQSTRLPYQLTDPGYRRLMLQLKIKF